MVAWTDAVDPHPGALIRANLAPVLPQLEYHELDRCGHYPWLERWASERFFALLRQWLVRVRGGERRQSTQRSSLQR